MLNGEMFTVMIRCFSNCLALRCSDLVTQAAPLDPRFIGINSKMK